MAHSLARYAQIFSATLSLHSHLSGTVVQHPDNCCRTWPSPTGLLEKQALISSYALTLFAAIPASTPLCIAATNAASSFSSAVVAVANSLSTFSQPSAASCLASSSIFSREKFTYWQSYGCATLTGCPLPVLALSQKMRRLSISFTSCSCCVGNSIFFSLKL